MPRSFLKSASSESSRRRIFAASPGAILCSFARGSATSNRSSCRRVRSTKASPSSYVIVRVGSLNAMTLFADMMASRSDGLREWFLVQLIIAAVVISAKQIETQSNTRRGRGCGIYALRSWLARNFNCWCTGSNSAARYRNRALDEKPFELCKGDLSIRLNFSMDGGSTCFASTTFSALEGCS